MVRWMRWHCPPDTGFEIWALAVWGRACYLSVTEALHERAGKKHFVSLKLEERSGVRTRDRRLFQAGSFNHCTRTHVLSKVVNNTVQAFEYNMPRAHCLMKRSIIGYTLEYCRNVRYYMHIYIAASELKDPIWHSLEWQIGSFSSEATICT